MSAEHVDRAGVDFIAGFEGYSGRVYRDAVGVPTIGYGHTGPDVWRLAPLTQAQALILLGVDLRRSYEPPVRALGLPLNQHQFDALVSFVYNLGAGVIGPSSTMGQMLRARNWRGADASFVLYDHAGGRVLLGLYRRRVAEARLFASTPANPWAHALAKWRAELAHRRAQLRTARAPGTRHYLRRRIRALRAAIAKRR
jgi:lysozyme